MLSNSIGLPSAAGYWAMLLVSVCCARVRARLSDAATGRPRPDLATPPAAPRRRAAAEYKLIHHASASESTVRKAVLSPPPAAAASPPPPPPPPPDASASATSSLPPPPPPNDTRARAVDVKGAADPGGAQRVQERSPLIQGMIEAGFSRAQADEALTAIGATAMTDVPKAIEWSLKKSADKNKLEASVAREVHTFDKMDFDGCARACDSSAQRSSAPKLLASTQPDGPRPHPTRADALVWGDKHRTRTLEECGARCIAWKPQPPSHFVCNVFVFCPLEKCYAPAALPPGSMTGQCWLKHQDDPNNPQVNMRGDYSAAYLKRHPGAPQSVQWQAGVVVRNGTVVDTATWSSRANW
mmetsp:Transcript_68248/g.204495  ORF Transcript_68248/g.204495 Transcript_68248/m.204495 type:complete len:355 (-) Transcript_68248:209-1273(-)